MAIYYGDNFCAGYTRNYMGERVNVADEKKESTGRSGGFRSTSRCLTWLALTLITLFIVITKDASALTILSFIFMLYSLESLITEAFGVSVDKQGIALPRQLLPRIPWIVFWRERILWEKIERINSLSDGQVRVITADRRIDTTFKNRDEKLQFIHAIKRQRPSMRIRRGT